MRVISTIIYAIAFPLLFSCSDYRRIEVNVGKDLKEYRLGESNYYISVPNKFNLEIAQGKEGQKGYSFSPVDSLFPNIAIEIDEGQRPGDKIFDWGKTVEKVKSQLLNGSITWTVFQTETGYFVAQSSGKKVWIEVNSKNQNEIDSLISFASTLIVK